MFSQYPALFYIWDHTIHASRIKEQELFLTPIDSYAAELLVNFLTAELEESSTSYHAIS